MVLLIIGSSSCVSCIFVSQAGVHVELGQVSEGRPELRQEAVRVRPRSFDSAAGQIRTERGGLIVVWQHQPRRD